MLFAIVIILAILIKCASIQSLSYGSFVVISSQRKSLDVVQCRSMNRLMLWKVVRITLVKLPQIVYYLAQYRSAFLTIHRNYCDISYATGEWKQVEYRTNRSMNYTIELYVDHEMFTYAFVVSINIMCMINGGRYTKRPSGNIIELLPLVNFIYS